MTLKTYLVKKKQIKTPIINNKSFYEMKILFLALQTFFFGGGGTRGLVARTIWCKWHLIEQRSFQGPTLYDKFLLSNFGYVIENTLITKVKHENSLLIKRMNYYLKIGGKGKVSLTQNWSFGLLVVLYSSRNMEKVPR